MIFFPCKHCFFFLSVGMQAKLNPIGLPGALVANLPYRLLWINSFILYTLKAFPRDHFWIIYSRTSLYWNFAIKTITLPLLTCLCLFLNFRICTPVALSSEGFITLFQCVISSNIWCIKLFTYYFCEIFLQTMPNCHNPSEEHIANFLPEFVHHSSLLE